MSKEIVFIPAYNKFDKELTDTITRKKKVCVYARVSTDELDQENSYSTQISEYTKIIQENPEWEFAGIYADKGFSGTSINAREQFKQMIDDCYKGKIDLILTKSISRFSRNTVDCLNIVRELRNHKIEIFFEKENLYSSDNKIDLLLSILTSVAQEEARNISENIKWSIRRGFAQGKLKMNTSNFLGYNKDKKGELIIDKEDAKTVRLIFNLYLCGYSYNNITFFLEDMKRLNGVKREKWYAANIGKILRNEKYKGDALLQKTVVLDYLTHKQVINKGHEKQYYIKDNHNPIIPKDIFDLVQTTLKEKNDESKSSTLKHISPLNENYLSGIVYCGKCNHTMTTAYVSINKKKIYYKILKCAHNRKQHGCSNTIKEENIKIPCDNSIYQLYENDKRKIKSLLEVLINSLLINNERQQLILSKILKLSKQSKVSYFRNIISRVIVNEDLIIKIIYN